MQPAAPVQTSYTRYQPPGMPGMLADSINWDADSRIVETAAGIAFGVACSQGTLSDDGCVVGGSNFVGVTRADQTLQMASSGTPAVDFYQRYDTASCLVKGDIWVLCYANVAVGAAVTFDATTGQLGKAGTTIPNAKWMTAANGSASAPVLAVLRLANIGR